MKPPYSPTHLQAKRRGKVAVHAKPLIAVEHVRTPLTDSEVAVLSAAYALIDKSFERQQREVERQEAVDAGQ